MLAKSHSVKYNVSGFDPGQGYPGENMKQRLVFLTTQNSLLFLCKHVISVPHSHLGALHGKDWTVNNDALILRHMIQA